MQPLFIAVGGPHDTLAGLVLIAVFDRSETGGLTIFPARGAGVLTVGGGGQSAAHAGTDLPHDLAVACAAFAERCFFGALWRRLVPARTVFAGFPVPRDRAIPGGGRDRRKQGVSEGQQGGDDPQAAHRTVLRQMIVSYEARGGVSRPRQAAQRSGEKAAGTTSMFSCLSIMPGCPPLGGQMPLDLASSRMRKRSPASL